VIGITLCDFDSVPGGKAATWKGKDPKVCYTVDDLYNFLYDEFAGAGQLEFKFVIYEECPWLMM